MRWLHDDLVQLHDIFECFPALCRTAVDGQVHSALVWWWGRDMDRLSTLFSVCSARRLLLCPPGQQQTQREEASAVAYRRACDFSALAADRARFELETYGQRGSDANYTIFARRS